MHRILLREVVIDVPRELFAATRDFWAAALSAEARRVPDYPEFTSLRDPAALSWVGLQEIGDGEPRLHFDIESDDVDAEVARLTGLGAEKVADRENLVVMRDPSGLLFDVLRPESPEFAKRSREVS